MRSELLTMRKMLLIMLFWGLVLTIVDILLVVSGWWTDFLEIWFLLVLGPLFLLVAPLGLITLRLSPSHLPEGWENWSREEQQDFGIKRAIEESFQGNKGAKLNLWMMRRNPIYRQRIDTFLTEREK